MRGQSEIAEGNLCQEVWELLWASTTEAPELARPLSPCVLICRAQLCLEICRLPPAEREALSDPGTCPPTDVSQGSGAQSQDVTALKRKVRQCPPEHASSR